jgi:hypothetical protein
MTDNDESPTLSNVTPYEWDDEQAIDFEVAQDTIGLFIAHCTDRYWTERRKPAPDQSIMDYWEEERAKAARVSQALRADDADAIRGILTTYGQRVRDLNGGPDA